MVTFNCMYYLVNQKVTASGSNTDKNTKSKTKNHKKESTDAADLDKKQKKEIITATDATDTDQIQKVSFNSLLP